MSPSFRAIAVDYDGTLTQDSVPDPDALSALEKAKAAGMKLVLVTGRIFSELLKIFPSAPSLFDAIVAENGLVLYMERAGLRTLSSPIPATLEQELRSRGVSCERGDVLLATDAASSAVVLEAIATLQLDCQLIRNRAALMIVPAGTSKGTGLADALGELGVSPHSVVGIGDAENDHALLEACEIGVAVANAIPSLKAHADVVLEAPAGKGVAAFVESIVEGSFRAVTPNRWRIPIGSRADGTAVTLPASGINVLIAGGSGSGKSYLAGLLAERLLQLGYSLCVLDPEGDHTQLGNLRGTVTLGGADGVPSPAYLGRLLHRRFGGAVVNLCLLRDSERISYTTHALDQLEAARVVTGLPHWIFLDEAHAALGEATGATSASKLTSKGYCLVTYHPIELRREALEAIDIVFLLPRSEELVRALLSQSWFSSSSGTSDELTERVRSLLRGEALMVDVRAKTAEIVMLGKRRSLHVRHKHKYVHGFLPPRHQFYFRDASGPTGRYAANLEDFHREIESAADRVLLHHAANRDFSRWLAQVLGDRALASDIAQIESSGVDASALRARFLGVMDARYSEDEEAPTSSIPPSA